ncbi:phosphatidylinositol-glycan biosynthesis class F protein isoform X1 [Trachypithecus francoisi]|uniref:phosphatidylinositol-glycan biosynthesis class F protein isoform X1 n=1 Tax=Trachypithecus francoisi TaxID=54180 RepID=UPI00141BE0F4|nr:phosphatidylinositol-glycan biosynthesis class F protein isoform X1 [Trachypithecus francoisi]
MKDTDIKRLLYTHLLCIFSIILSVFIPSLFLENFSILETHLTWLCICSGFVTAVNLVLYLAVKPNTSSKRSSLSHKVTRFLKCCIYFLMSCFSFHVIFVLYGAPLIELALETFLFAVILSTFTTVPCLCLLGPNLKAWLRVFSRNGVTSIWENSLQMTTISSFVGAWLGALPIPLDWERPWQKEDIQMSDAERKFLASHPVDSLHSSMERYGPSPVRLERPLAMWLALLFHHSGYTGIESNLHTRTINWSKGRYFFVQIL